MRIALTFAGKLGRSIRTGTTHAGGSDVSFLSKAKKKVAAATKVVAAKSTLGRALSKTGSIAKKAAATSGRVAKKAVVTSAKTTWKAQKLANKAAVAPLKYGIKAHVGALKVITGGIKSSVASFKKKPATPAADDGYGGEAEDAAAEYGQAESSAESFAPPGDEGADSYVDDSGGGDAAVQEFISEPADADYEDGDAEQMGALDYAYALADAEGTGLAGAKDVLLDAGKAAGRAAAGSLLGKAQSALGITGNAPARVDTSGGVFGLTKGQTMVAGAGLGVLALWAISRRR